MRFAECDFLLVIGQTSELMEIGHSNVTRRQSCCKVFSKLNIFFSRTAEHSGRNDVFKFSEIIDNISKTVQDRDIVTVEDKHMWAIEWHDCR